MNHLSPDDLSALLDGEQEEGRAHLEACERCRAEWVVLGRLESLMRAGRAACAPAPEAVVAAVRRRLGGPRRASWRPAALVAAAALFAAALWRLGAAGEPPVADLVEMYALKGNPEAARAIVARGTEGLRGLAELLDAPDARLQAAAVELFGRFDPEQARRVLLARESDRGPIDLLARSPYADSNDDLGLGLRQAARLPGHRRFALEELARADLMAGLTSEDPELQQRAVVWISKTRNPRFGAAEMIELMDQPVLRQKLLQILPRATGQDFGEDAEQWKAYLRRVAASRS
jgi:hypothetical protein